MFKKLALYTAVLICNLLPLISFCHAQEIVPRNLEALKEIENLYVAVNFINMAAEQLPDLEIKMEKIKKSMDKYLKKTGLKIMKKEDLKGLEEELKSQVETLQNNNKSKSKEDLQKAIKVFLQKENKQLAKQQFAVLNVIITVNAVLNEDNKEKNMVFVKASVINNKLLWYAEIAKSLIFKKHATIRVKPIVKKLTSQFAKDFKTANEE